MLVTMFRDKFDCAYFLLVLILTVCLTWLLSPKDHQVELNKRFNEIEEQMKQLEHDITTQLSTYTTSCYQLRKALLTTLKDLVC